jgi:hypothetical protein
MQTYHIINSSQFYTLRESSGKVTAASPIFDWAVGLEFAYVRNYCEKKGWTIVPVINELDVTTFEYRGSQYCLYTDGCNIKQITKDDKEISWKEFPSMLKG